MCYIRCNTLDLRIVQVPSNFLQLAFIIRYFVLQLLGNMLKEAQPDLLSDKFINLLLNIVLHLSRKYAINSR